MTIEPELRGQTVVVIGGSAGIGLETARRARGRGRRRRSSPAAIPSGCENAAGRLGAAARRRSTPTTGGLEDFFAASTGRSTT